MDSSVFKDEESLEILKSASSRRLKSKRATTLESHIDWILKLFLLLALIASVFATMGLFEQMGILALLMGALYLCGSIVAYAILKVFVEACFATIDLRDMKRAE